MSRFVIFGDSYACVPSQGYPALETTWHYKVAQNLKLEYQNYGESGTNLDWSVQQYFKYLKNRKDNNDYIIFVLTAPERLWFSDMEHPRDGNLGSDKKNKWRQRNKDLIEYLLAWTPQEVWDEAQNKSALLLKGCAHLHQHLLVIQGGEQLRGQHIRELALMDNENFSYPSWSLGRLSKDEFSNHEDWKKNVTHETYRSNHLNLDSHLIVEERLTSFFSKKIKNKIKSHD